MRLIVQTSVPDAHWFRGVSNARQAERMQVTQHDAHRRWGTEAARCAADGGDAGAVAGAVGVGAAGVVGCNILSAADIGDTRAAGRPDARGTHGMGARLHHAVGVRAACRHGIHCADWGGSRRLHAAVAQSGGQDGRFRCSKHSWT